MSCNHLHITSICYVQLLLQPPIFYPSTETPTAYYLIHLLSVQSYRLARTRAMLPATLPNLAPELVVQIFNSIDDFATIAPRSRASSKFLKVGKANTVSIRDVVLLCAIDCYDEACELLEAQGRIVRERVELDRWADKYLGSPSLARSMPNADEAVTEQARRFMQNSKRTLQELEDFNIDLLEPRSTLHPARRDLTHHENSASSRLCYRATTIVTLAYMRMSL